LRVWDGSGWSPVPAAQQRVLLAILLVEAGQVVSTERLVEELWGTSPPKRAASTVQVYVGRLRRLLGPGADQLVTRGSGYQLVVADGEVDAHEFDRGVAVGQDARGQGRLGDAVDRLTDALSLWQGPAMADVPASPAVAGEVARLEQRRLTALDDRIGVQLDLGRYAEVVDELAKLVAENPLQERLHAQYMLALYRDGRRADALEAYQHARRVLVAELGLEPGAQLRRLQKTILDDDWAMAGPTELGVPATHRAPAQLPADVAGFTGRTEYLRRLDALVAQPGTMVIAAIDGTGGVGKTALATHWAHLVRDRFTDGQLYVNLRGYATAPPLRSLDALAGFLRALGVPPDRVPVELDEAAALYRSLLAGRRVLVLLDNARHPDQVRPLLPAEPGCAVIVTSRDRLDGLLARDGAVRVELDTLLPEEAQRLLGGLLDGDGTGGEHEAVAELARLCGYLPLALRIAGADLAAHPRQSIADYTARLRTGDRLTALQMHGDIHANVRATFDLSYAAQPPEAQRLFRLLGLAPGADLTAIAAAALADIPQDQASLLLDQLTAAHLVLETTQGRYGLHDLLRFYAATRAASKDDEPDRDAALRRWHDFHLYSVDAAALTLYPHILRVPLPAASVAPGASFADHTQALAWLDAERANLVATILHAARRGQHQVVWRLADALRGYFDLRLHTVEWAAVAQAAHSAARSGGDLRGHAAAHLSLALLNWVSSRYQQAIENYTEALRLSRQAHWPHASAVALGNLGGVYWHLGSLAQATDHYTQAVAIDRATGRIVGQANNLYNLGIVHLAAGRTQMAMRHFRDGIARCQEAGSRAGEGRATASLGEAYRALGRTDAALTTLDRALAIQREVGDRLSQTDTTRVLALTHNDVGRYPDAADLADTAVALAHETASRLAQAEALVARATIHHHLDRLDEAIRDAEQGLHLAREISNQHVEADALTVLAAVGHHLGHLDQAAARVRQALAVCRQHGYRPLEGNAFIVLAAINLSEGQPKQAVDQAERAVDIHRENGRPLGQARAHLVAGHAARVLGRDDEARAHQQRALEIFGEIGAEWRHHARTTLRMADRGM
jgi:DNA-binding SARP family transcriptional activator